MKKNICIDCRMIGMSGIGTYIKEILAVILKSQNYRFTLLGDINLLDKYKSSTVEICHYEDKIYSVKEQINLIRYTKKCDLFWSPHYNAPLFCKSKLLVTIHDLFHLDNPQYTKGLLQKIYPRLMFKMLNKRASSIITVSNFTKERYKKLVDNDRELAVIHNGIHESWYVKPEKNIKEKLPYIIYVGNVKPHKNLKVLVNAFKNIHSQLPHDLVIVGKKEGFITNDEEINVLAGEIANRIKFTGYISEEDLKSYVANADCLVFPSLYEGFGLPPLEAMAIGCPTIVSNVSSIPEVCGEGSTYFDPNSVAQLEDKLKEVLLNEEHKSNLRKKGLEKSREYSWEKAGKETLTIINQLL
ncbi:glycosyltransferase family 1 protein [Priestia megaterium]